MPLAFPMRVDATGRAAEAGPEEHVRQLVEQLLFTAPGERLGRPELGAGLDQLLFAPSDDALAAATRHLLEGALQGWLGELITVEAVELRAEQEVLYVHVRYHLNATGLPGEVQVARGVGA